MILACTALQLAVSTHIAIGSKGQGRLGVFSCLRAFPGTTIEEVVKQVELVQHVSTCLILKQ